MGTDSTGGPVLRLGPSAPALDAALAPLTDRRDVVANLALQEAAPARSEASVCPKGLQPQSSARALAVAHGQLHVVTVLADDDGLTSDGLTWLVASAAQCSAHPPVQAIVHFAREHGQKLAQPTHFEALPQYGARATVDGRVVLIGNRELMRNEGVDLGTLEQRAAELESMGRTVMYIAVDGLKAGAMAIADEH